MKNHHWLEKRLSVFENWCASNCPITKGSVHAWWKEFDRGRHECVQEMKRIGKWNDHVFVSHDIALIILLMVSKVSFSSFSRMMKENIDFNLATNQLISDLVIMSAWRPCKDIVKFDDGLYDELKNTDSGCKLPSDILSAIPSWSIYIEAPDLVTQDIGFDGFFAGLIIDNGQLKLKLDFQNSDIYKSDNIDYYEIIHGENRCLSIALPLGDWSLEEACQKVNDIVRNNFKDSPEINPDGTIHVDLVGKFRDICSGDEILQIHADAGLIHALNMVIYVCSFGLHEKKGYKPGQEFHQPQRGEKKFNWRIFEAPQANVWKIGEEFGKTVRTWHKRTSEIVAKRGPIRTHMRRSHWHGYWTGPKKGPEPQEFVVKLLAPIIVRGNMKLEDEEESGQSFSMGMGG